MAFEKGNSDIQSVNNVTFTWKDAFWKWFSIIYLLILLGLFSWQLFDTWNGKHVLPLLFKHDITRLNTPNFRLVYYSVLGGALGGVLNGLRSYMQHSSYFKAEYVGKYVVGPWMGAILGITVYALIHSSISVFGGGGNTSNVGTAQALSNFAAGVLAGYGAKDVFVWLDAQVSKVFKVTPDIRGLQEEEARARVQAVGAEVGTTTKVATTNGVRPGTVIDQQPGADMPMVEDQKVDLVTGGNSEDGADESSS